MPVIGLRRLSRETRDVVKEMQDSGEPVIVARRGEPVAVLLPATPERLRDAAMAISPESRTGFDEADAEFAEGKTRPLDEVFAELDGVASLEEDGEEESDSAPVDYDELVALVGKGLAKTVIPQVPVEYRKRTETLNAKLLEGLVGSGLEQAISRAQSMNERLLERAGGGQASESLGRYLSMLDLLAMVERPPEEASIEAKAHYFRVVTAEDLQEVPVEAEAAAPEEFA